MTVPTEPQALPQPAPVQVIGYASREMVAVATTPVRVLLGVLAGFHLLLGAPLVLWTVVAVVRNPTGSLADPAAMLWALSALLVGGGDVACGVWMIVRRPWTWRAAQVALAALCVVELIVCGFGAGLIVAYKHAQGWDGIALAIGVFLFAAGSALFWLHALSKFALLRVNVRVAFFLSGTEPFRLHRVGTTVMMSLYGVIVLTGCIAYAVR